MPHVRSILSAVQPLQSDFEDMHVHVLKEGLHSNMWMAGDASSVFKIPAVKNDSTKYHVIAAIA